MDLSRAAFTRGIDEGQAVAVDLDPRVMAEQVDKHQAPPGARCPTRS